MVLRQVHASHHDQVRLVGTVGAELSQAELGRSRRGFVEPVDSHNVILDIADDKSGTARLEFNEIAGT